MMKTLKQRIKEIEAKQREVITEDDSSWSKGYVAGYADAQAKRAPKLPIPDKSAHASFKYDESLNKEEN